MATERFYENGKWKRSVHRHIKDIANLVGDINTKLSHIIEELRDSLYLLRPEDSYRTQQSHEDYYNEWTENEENSD